MIDGFRFPRFEREDFIAFWSGAISNAMLSPPATTVNSRDQKEVGKARRFEHHT